MTAYQAYLARYKRGEVEPLPVRHPDPYEFATHVLARNSYADELKGVLNRILKDSTFTLYQRIHQIMFAEQKFQLGKMIKGRCVYSGAPAHTTYVYLGRAKGAGMHRGQEMEVYLDPLDGQAYFRGMMDYQQRMLKR